MRDGFAAPIERVWIEKRLNRRSGIEAEIDHGDERHEGQHRSGCRDYPVERPKRARWLPRPVPDHAAPRLIGTTLSASASSRNAAHVSITPRPCQPLRVVRAKPLGGIAKTREECRSLA
jgi:hypothetical protein